MKVVLIDPKGLTLGMNSGLGYLAASIKKNGHSVSVIDLNNKPGNEEKRLGITKDADYVGISIKTFTMEESLKIARTVRKLNPDAIIIAGGPHITIDGHTFMRDNKDFEIAVFGEGEKTIIDIIAKKDLAEIKGIVYREGDKLKSNPKDSWIHELDKLPYPDYTCFDSEMDAYPLVTSRGCPYQCTYCSIRDVMGTLWRARSPGNIIDELKNSKKVYKATEFKILDDNFTLDINRTKKICRMLIENKIEMKWSCPNGIRADRLDRELIYLMKDSGCYSISIGIESLHPEVFEKITKGEKLSDVKKAIAMIKHAGIKVNGFFIIGLPGSTYVKDAFSIHEAKKLVLDSSSWGILVPYPGTKAWNWLNNEIKKGNAKMLMDWKKGFHVGFMPGPVFETTRYKSRDMLKAFYLANMTSMGTSIFPFILRTIFNKVFR